MVKVTLDLQNDAEPILRCHVNGIVGDVDAARWLELILDAMPQARGWPTLLDIRRYDGGVTWAGIVRLARIRGPAPRSRRNRTAVVADDDRYGILIGKADAAYSTLIARRVRLFHDEETAVAWLKEHAEEHAESTARRTASRSLRRPVRE